MGEDVFRQRSSVQEPKANMRVAQRRDWMELHVLKAWSRRGKVRKEKSKRQPKFTAWKALLAILGDRLWQQSPGWLQWTWGRGGRLRQARGSRVKKMVVTCMWGGETKDHSGVLGHVCRWWYSLLRQETLEKRPFWWGGGGHVEAEDPTGQVLRDVQ